MEEGTGDWPLGIGEDEEKKDPLRRFATPPPEAGGRRLED